MSSAPQTASVLVTDAEQRSALAVVRSLGRAGHRVATCGARSGSIAAASRYSSRFTLLADPLTEPDRFAQGLASICKSNGTEIVLPVTDASTLAITEHASLFAGVKLPLPLDGRFAALCDKENLMRRARAIGIAVPRQETLQSPADASQQMLASIRFPVVVKPARSVFGRGALRGKLVVAYASNPADLSRQISALPEHAFPVMLQQRITGPGIGIFVILWKGEVKALFSHRRLREKPPSGGVCVYGESRAAEPDLVSQSVALLRDFDWEGVAMVEYKMDAQTNVPYLMEVNPRFWGSLQLAIDSGVDFPRLLVDLMLGVDPDPVLKYRIGERTRWFWGDVDHLIARLKRPDEFPAGGVTDPGRARALKEFLFSFRPGERNEVLRLSDPRPFFMETWNWLRARP